MRRLTNKARRCERSGPRSEPLVEPVCREAIERSISLLDFPFIPIELRVAAEVGCRNHPECGAGVRLLFKGDRASGYFSAKRLRRSNSMQRTAPRATAGAERHALQDTTAAKRSARRASASFLSSSSLILQTSPGERLAGDQRCQYGSLPTRRPAPDGSGTIEPSVA